MTDDISAMIAEEAKSINEPMESRQVGMFTIEKATVTTKKAQLAKTPDALWHKCWYEGELCCLFADSNTGKSVLAYQIGEEISQKQKIIYFDFELSDKQFELRYEDEEHGPYHFNNNFWRGTIDPYKMEVDNFEEKLINSIENSVIKSKAKVIIIDNISFLCMSQDKADEAGRLMQKLVGLKCKHGLSILVIAHTPKRNMSRPLSQNDLAGSKKLFNFLDSCFAIGFCADKPGYRYIKQLKMRYGEFEWDSNHVMVCKLEKIRNFLGFTLMGTEPEKNQLNTHGRSTEEDAARRIMKILEMYGKGFKKVAIAKEIGTTPQYVGGVIKRYPSA